MPTALARMPSAAPVLRAAGSDQARRGTLSYARSTDLSRPGTLTNTTAAVPQPAPPLNAPPFTYTPPGQPTAPTPTPYGDFTAPDPLTFQQDPSYQWRLQQGQKLLERGAAARGTLLSGGFQKALQDYGQGAASQEYGNAFNRALLGYTTNRDTNAQNFGQQMDVYTGRVNAGLGYGRLGLDAAEAQRRYGYQDALDKRSYEQELNDYNAELQGGGYGGGGGRGPYGSLGYGGGMSEYEANLERTRAENNAAAERAQQARIAQQRAYEAAHRRPFRTPVQSTTPRLGGYAG